MGARIGILFNCQHESLAVALRALLPDATVLSFELNKVPLDQAARAPITAALAECDHVISQDIAPGYGALSTRALRPVMRRFHLLPAFHFGGFHPDTVSVRIDGVPVRSAAGSIHSRIVIASVLAGLSAQEAGELFNPLVFARLGYFDALAEHTALLIEKFLAYGIDLAPIVPKWCGGGCFMHDTHHPKMVVFVDLARIACTMMGIDPQADPPLAALRDPLAAFPTAPFLPDIAARCGMRPDGVFRESLTAPPLSLDDYVAGSIQSVARVPLCCLRAVPGVQEAMARLDLAPQAAPRRATVSSADFQGLLSWHGTIVRIEAASSLLVHERLWPVSPDCDDFTLRFAAGPDGIARADILGGLEQASAIVPRAITLARQGRMLVAEAARLAVPFKGDGTGHDDAFLAVSVAEIADLRTILSQGWCWDGTPRRAAAARIRLRPGFVLDFGIFTIDLTQGRPVPVPAGEAGGPGYVLQSPAGPITIRPIAEPAPGREIALLADPQRRMPDEAGSIPEFRTALNASWSLPAADEILHPPLTASQRDAAWVLERCTVPGGLPIGVKLHRATLRRMTGKSVLLSPGLEGIVFDDDGILAGAAPASLPRPHGLPAGMRMEEGAVLIEAAQRRAAPMIEEPVALCLGPDWREEGGGLIDVALRLHVMAPLLPRGTRLLVPQGCGEGQSLLAALGLDQFPVLEAPAPLCRLADAVWLDESELATMQAALLRGFRARIAALFPTPAGPPARLYIERDGAQRIAQNDAWDGFLAAQGFTTIVPEAHAPAALIALFRGAEMVIGAHGAGLANIVFCPDGARVLEISPRGQFRPRYWMLAEKCGLIHGVLPCATEGGGFDSAIQLDVARMRALFRVLRLSLEK